MKKLRLNNLPQVIHQERCHDSVQNGLQQDSCSSPPCPLLPHPPNTASHEGKERQVKCLSQTPNSPKLLHPPMRKSMTFSKSLGIWKMQLPHGGTLEQSRAGAWINHSTGKKNVSKLFISKMKTLRPSNLKEFIPLLSVAKTRAVELKNLRRHLIFHQV